MPAEKPADRFLRCVIDAAERHGLEDDSDHEVGDLQTLVWALWHHMPAAKRTEFTRSEEWLDFIALHTGARHV